MKELWYTARMVEYQLEEPTVEEITAMLYELGDKSSARIEKNGSGLTEDPRWTYPPATPIKLVCGDIEIELCNYDLSRVRELKCITGMGGECEIMEAVSREAFLKSYAAARAIVIAYQTEWRMKRTAWQKENSPLGDGI